MTEEKTIKLGQFLKLCSWVGSGAEAKMVIGDGAVLVNGQIETRRGRKLRDGDTVEFEGQTATVELT